MQDVLADNAKIRENLTDDIALSFIEWGREIAEHVATRFAAPDIPAPDEQQINDAGYNLGRLMTRINWLVTYRTKKDADWLARTFAMVNKLSQDVYGADAPTFSDDEIAAWVVDQANHTDNALLHDLMMRYTPASLQPSGDASPTKPGDTEPEMPSSPLSNAVFGKPENLSDAVFGTESESLHPSGEEKNGEEVE
jgi:hypothetical protein